MTIYLFVWYTLCVAKKHGIQRNVLHIKHFVLICIVITILVIFSTILVITL